MVEVWLPVEAQQSEETETEGLLPVGREKEGWYLRQWTG